MTDIAALMRGHRPGPSPRVAVAAIERGLFGADATPASIGRYEVLRRRGAGAHAVVYAVLDRELGRTAAAKVMRASNSTSAQARLVCEARALAAVEHPNLVRVFDVGVSDGSVFVVLEHIGGPTLGVWLAQSPPLARVLEVMVAAGRGLAAVHRAGYVHGDFKPANVLIGDDGRPRVADLELASVRGAAAEVTAGECAVAEEDTVRSVPVWGGTPGYLAPEQRPSAAADQYAFGVVLCEALTEHRPACSGLDAALDRVRHVAGRRVRDVVARALADDPDRRYPSMDALADELRAPSPRRWLWAAGGLLAIGAVAAAWPDAAPDGCPTLANRWSPAAADRLDAAWGTPTTRQVALRRDLDHYAAQWSAARAEVCQAAARGSPLRRCHDDAALRFAALVDDLERSPQAPARLVAGRLAALPHVVDCRSGGTPRRPAWVRGALAQLDGARGASVAGAHARAESRWRSACALREHSQDLNAACHYEHARLLERQGRFVDAEAEATTAYLAASEHRLDGVATAAATAVARLVGEQQQRPDDAEVWVGRAQALLHGNGSALQRVALLRTRAGLARVQGRYQDAAAAIDEAIGLQRDRLGPAHPGLGLLHNAAGALRGLQGDSAGAIENFEHARTIFASAFGPDDPILIGVFDNLGAAHREGGALGEAEAWMRKALRLRERQLEPDAHAAVARSNLAAVLGDQGRWAEAEHELRAALQRLEHARGGDAPIVATTRANLGSALAHQGHADEARRELAAATAALEAALGHGHPDLRRLEAIHAKALNVLGRHDEAAGLARSAATASADPRIAVLGNLELGRAHLGLGDRVAAASVLRPALARASELGLPPTDRHALEAALRRAQP